MCYVIPTRRPAPRRDGALRPLLVLVTAPSGHGRRRRRRPRARVGAGSPHGGGADAGLAPAHLPRARRRVPDRRRGRPRRLPFLRLRLAPRARLPDLPPVLPLRRGRLRGRGGVGRRDRGRRLRVRERRLPRREGREEGQDGVDAGAAPPVRRGGGVPRGQGRRAQGHRPAHERRGPHPRERRQPPPEVPHLPQAHAHPREAAAASGLPDGLRLLPLQPPTVFTQLQPERSLRVPLPRQREARTRHSTPGYGMETGQRSIRHSEKEFMETVRHVLQLARRCFS